MFTFFIIAFFSTLFLFSFLPKHRGLKLQLVSGCRDGVHYVNEEKRFFFAFNKTWLKLDKIDLMLVNRIMHDLICLSYVCLCRFVRITSHKRSYSCTQSHLTIPCIVIGLHLFIFRWLLLFIHNFALLEYEHTICEIWKNRVSWEKG